MRGISLVMWDSGIGNETGNLYPIFEEPDWATFTTEMKVKILQSNPNT